LKLLIDKLFNNNLLSREEFLLLLGNMNEDDTQYLFEKSSQKKAEHYGNTVYMRGLIEFTNYCKQNCVYCGIRAENKNADRYRLSSDEILDICDTGYGLGFRTFVLQGGEDDTFTDDKMTMIIKSIKKRFPSCAITLSIGEKPRSTYQKYFDAGADRYLLRHETASPLLYKKLHPFMSLENRKRCLYDLKDIGFQVGAGFMVGLPDQTDNDLVNDLLFLKELSPQMVGIGPFIPHKDTPLGNENGGTAEKTLIMIALVRLILPEALLPSTTALGTIDPLGREKGIRAGGNVVMPNLSPISVRSKYSLYDGKICTNDEATKCLKCIGKRIQNVGCSVDMSRGDHKNWSDEK